MGRTIKELAPEAIQRLTHWITHYGKEKQRPFIDDLTVVLAMAQSVPDKLFVVGQLIEKPEEHNGHTWEVCGVFSTAEKADAACSTPNHFYGSEVLDVAITGPPTPWPDCVWPRRT